MKKIIITITILVGIIFINIFNMPSIDFTK